MKKLGQLSLPQTSASASAQAIIKYKRYISYQDDDDDGDDDGDEDDDDEYSNKAMPKQFQSIFYNADYVIFKPVQLTVEKNINNTAVYNKL